MKHTIRSHTVDPIRGHVTKVEKFFGELASGVFDKHGREIFEGDLIRFEGNTLVVKFNRGSLCYGNQPLRNFDDGDFEIVEQAS